jgi:hypothetical protein
VNVTVYRTCGTLTADDVWVVPCTVSAIAGAALHSAATTNRAPSKAARRGTPPRYMG